MRELFKLSGDIVDFHIGVDTYGVYYYERTDDRTTGVTTYYETIEDLLEAEDLMVDNDGDLL